MKVIDVCLPEPKTELEAFKRWKNRLASEYISGSPFSRKILIDDDPAETEVEQTEREVALAESRQDYLDSVDEDRYQQDQS